jgi:hypothetical protein
MYKLKADITRLTQELESEKQNSLLEIQKIKEENLQDIQNSAGEHSEIM